MKILVFLVLVSLLSCADSPRTVINVGKSPTDTTGIEKETEKALICGEASLYESVFARLTLETALKEFPTLTEKSSPQLEGLPECVTRKPWGQNEVKYRWTQCKFGKVTISGFQTLTYKFEDGQIHVSGEFEYTEENHGLKKLQEFDVMNSPNQSSNSGGSLNWRQKTVNTTYTLGTHKSDSRQYTVNLEGSFDPSKARLLSDLNIQVLGQVTDKNRETFDTTQALQLNIPELCSNPLGKMNYAYNGGKETLRGTLLTNAQSMTDETTGQFRNWSRKCE